jgi:hypothetical protein
MLLNSLNKTLDEIQMNNIIKPRSLSEDTDYTSQNRKPSNDFQN